MSAPLTNRFCLADLFDRLGRLRPFRELPPHITAEIASFEVVRITTRTDGETVVTEELIRVKTRDRRTAEIARRGGSTGTARSIRSQPIIRGIVKTTERLVGGGHTETARAAVPVTLSRRLKWSKPGVAHRPFNDLKRPTTALQSRHPAERQK